jgi:hypothetical protein
MREIKMKKECLVKYSWWGKKVSDHTWAYIDYANRICEKCGRREILVYYICGGASIDEDWRKAYKAPERKNERN